MTKKKRKIKLWVKIAAAILIAGVLLLAGMYIVSALNAPKPEKEQGGFSDVDVDKGDQKIDDPEKKDPEKLTYMVLDVGQGLSVFIDFGNTEVLIDGGPYEAGPSVVEKIKPYVDGPIEYVIATHSHEDHVGGLQFVYDAFDVDKTIYGDLSDENYFYYFEAAAKAKSEFVEDYDTTISLGRNANCTLTIYDIADNEENTNNNSVVTLIKYGNTSFLCTGDLEKEQEAKLTTLVGQTSVVVAGHHGSNTSNSIYKYLKPAYIAISCGRNNDYFQPHESVLSDMMKYTKKIYGTFRSGDIVFTSDGRQVVLLNDSKQVLTQNDAGAKGN